MQKIWGYHGIFNLSRCCPQSIRCPKNIETFSNILVKRIDMVPYGKPQIVHFGENDKLGYTLVQLIQTSNIMAHFVEENNSAFIDVFSCKPYNMKIAEDVIRHYFKPDNLHKTLLMRRAPDELK